MEGLPLLDYAPGTLLGIGVLLIFFGKLVPWPSVKRDREQLLARIETLEGTVTYLEAALNKTNDALAETIQQNTDYQETTRLARATWQALLKGAE